MLVLGVYTVWSSRQQEQRARGRELTAHAATLEAEDPARALYLGWQAGQMGRPGPPELEAVLAAALTNRPSYGILLRPSGSREQRRLEPGWEDPRVGKFRQNDPAMGGGQRSAAPHTARSSEHRDRCGLESGWEDACLSKFRQHDPVVGGSQRSSTPHTARP